jgi:CRP/FNR family cyclic AMP-dependent transcriptional regulator
MPSKPASGIVPTTFLRTKGQGKHIRVYQDKEVIYLQESHADAVFYLQSGMVKLTTGNNSQRRKAVLAVLQEGDFFGEGCLGRETRRMCTATSVGRSTVTRLAKATFSRKINQDRAFAAALIKYFVSQMARFKSDLADLFLNCSEKRLARILLMHKCLVQQSQIGTPPPAFQPDSTRRDGWNYSRTRQQLYD